MKKIASIVLSLVIMALGITTVSAREVNVYYDGVLTTLSDASGFIVRPFIKDGTTYVPLRGVSELLGCDVEWNGNDKIIKIFHTGASRDGYYSNWSNDIKVYLDGESVEFKTANGSVVKPFIQDGTTYVPLRGFSETMGCQVDWNSSEFAVKIWNEVVPPEGTPLYYLQPSDSEYLNFYYDIDGKQLDIDGEKYTNALESCDSWFDRYAVFDINGKYDNMTFVAGSSDNFEMDKEITFIVDGKIADTYTIKANSDPREIKVDLDYGLTLKIKINHSGCGMGNIVFH